jgi:hypothetical protein
MNNWPSILPNPRIGLSYRPESNLIVQQMEAGNIRQRKRFDGSVSYFNVKLVCSNFQRKVFEGFHKHTLDDGSLFIDDFPLPNGNQSVFIFGGNFEVVDLSGGVLWEISFTIVSEVDTIVSKEDLDYYIAFGGDPSLFSNLLVYQGNQLVYISEPLIFTV